MVQKIKIRRGLKKDLPVLDTPELGFCTDTKELYIGTESGNELIGGSSADKTTITKGSNGIINVDGVEIKVFDDEQIKSLINSKVDISALNYKANVTDLDNAISAVNANLFGKVTKTEVESLLANKADKSYVDSEITKIPTVKGDTGLQGERGEPGIPGASLYTWIKYATSSTGTNISDNPGGMTYIGMATNKTTATKSSNPVDYTWTLLKGEKGDAGATALSSLTDVVVSNANEGDVLSLSEGKWVPKTINVGSGSNVPTDARLFIENGVLYYEHSGVSTFDFTLNENGELVVTY